MKSAMLRGSPAVPQVIFRAKVKSDGGVRILTASAPALKSRVDKTVPHLTGPVVHYTIEYAISPSQIQFYSSAGLYRGRLAFSAIAYDADGKMLNSDVGTFAMPLNAAVYAAVQRDALHIRAGSICLRERSFCVWVCTT